MRRLTLLFLCILFVLAPIASRASFPEPILQKFTYQGELDDGGSPADGVYDFEFSLFDCVTGGTQLGATKTFDDVTVAAGRFAVEVDMSDLFVDGTRMFVEIGVRPGASGGAYTTLSPRQELTAAPSALTLRPNALIRDPGLFAAWLLKLEAGTGSLATGLEVETDYGVGITARSANATAIKGTYDGTGLSAAVSGWTYSPNSQATAVFGAVPDAGSHEGSRGVHGANQGAGMGVLGEHLAATGAAPGVKGSTASVSGGAAGVLGEITSTTPGSYSAGVRGVNNGTGGNGVGVYGSQAGTGWGVYGQAPDGRGVYGYSDAGTGVYGFSSTGAGVSARSNTGDVFVGRNASGNVFRVDSNGNVTADGSYTSPAADFAELLPSVGEVEPTDVLVVNPDGKLERSLKAYDSAVAGVYSTRPAFVGGSTGENSSEDIPLAVVGVVPVKVTDENGPIVPGDLLVASSTPGHAMRAGDDPPNGTVIGKALEPSRDRTGVVRAILMLQ